MSKWNQPYCLYGFSQTQQKWNQGAGAWTNSERCWEHEIVFFRRLAGSSPLHRQSTAVYKIWFNTADVHTVDSVSFSYTWFPLYLVYQSLYCLKQIGMHLDTGTEHNKVCCFNQLLMQYFSDQSARGDQSSAAFACIPLSFDVVHQKKCTYLKRCSPPASPPMLACKRHTERVTDRSILKGRRRRTSHIVWSDQKYDR